MNKGYPGKVSEEKELKNYFPQFWNGTESKSKNA